MLSKAKTAGKRQRAEFVFEGARRRKKQIQVLFSGIRGDAGARALADWRAEESKSVEGDSSAETKRVTQTAKQE